MAKYFTQINYAQGLFIWIFNKQWFYSLPRDLQKTFKQVVHEVCSQIREETKIQEQEEIEKAKHSGVKFFKLSEEEMKILKKAGRFSA